MSENTTATPTGLKTLDEAKKFIIDNGTESSNAKGPVLSVPKSAISKFMDECGVPQAMLERVRSTESLLMNAAASVAGDRLLENVNAKKSEEGFDISSMRYTVRMKGEGGNSEVVMGGMRQHNNPQTGDKTTEYGWMRATVGVDRCFDKDMISQIQDQVRAAVSAS